MQIVDRLDYCFIHRPRRFGKSLMISTLDAMFQGRADLFKGLAAEEWVKRQSEHPSPVIRLDMSAVQSSTPGIFQQSLLNHLGRSAAQYELTIDTSIIADAFSNYIQDLCESCGPVVVLIDEYDAPMLNHIDKPEICGEIRELLRSFYLVLKSSDDRLRFVMFTGVSKSGKVGVFSGLNNIKDLSLFPEYSEMLGITESELEKNFVPWLDALAEKQGLSRAEAVNRMREYYDGFSFDGIHRVYNPYSVLNCLNDLAFEDYWYESATPSFLMKYIKTHGITSPEEFSGTEVDKDFMNICDIEYASPESFLCQTGYLTICGVRENSFILDYPNNEVRHAISRLYLGAIYAVPGYPTLASKFPKEIRTCDIEAAVKTFNEMLAPIPYEDFKLPHGVPKTSEAFFRSKFVMAAHATGLNVAAETHTRFGRSDAIIFSRDATLIFEFKAAADEAEADKKLTEAKQQIKARHYAEAYRYKSKPVRAFALVADISAKKIIRCEEAATQ